MKKVLKAIGILLLILLILIVAVIIVIRIFAGKNNRVMNETIDKGMAIVRENYNVKELDAGEYKDMRFYGIMKFHVDQYEVETLGNLSVMTADMGFMQMVSFLITPYEKNLPVCTLDYMYIFGTRKSYTEFYNLAGDANGSDYQTVNAELLKMVGRYSDIEELKVDPHWYDVYLDAVMHKQLSSSEDARNQDMFCDALRTYLEASKNAEAASPEVQKIQLEKTQNYCDGLIEKGGVSTDVFKQALGEDKTHDFFDRVFFGTALYRD